MPENKTVGTRIEWREYDTGDHDVFDVLDNYVVIVDGCCYVDGVQVRPDGSHVVTMRFDGQDVEP